MLQWLNLFQRFPKWAVPSNVHLVHTDQRVKSLMHEEAKPKDFQCSVQ